MKPKGIFTQFQSRLSGKVAVLNSGYKQVTVRPAATKLPLLNQR